MADQRGYDMLLCYASSTEYTQLQRQLASHKVDGVILTYAMADDPCVDLLRQYDVPFCADWPQRGQDDTAGGQ